MNNRVQKQIDYIFELESHEEFMKIRYWLINCGDVQTGKSLFKNKKQEKEYFMWLEQLQQAYNDLYELFDQTVLIRKRK